MKTIGDILKGVEITEMRGDPKTPVSGIELNSKRVVKNSCFFAIKGFKQDGNKFIKDAVGKGASVIVSEDGPDTCADNITWVKIKDIRRVYSLICSNFYNSPLKGKYVIGVTGTNGKTTVVSLINSIFTEASKTVRVGTLGMECGKIRVESKLTTPEAGDLYKFLAEDCGMDFKTVVMEVSSAGLVMGRVEGIEFSQAVFTNFSGDHLDFHGSMNEYFSAKLSLFKQLGKESWAVINLDDDKGPAIIEEIDSKCITYGFSERADIYPVKSIIDVNGIKAEINTPKGIVNIESSLIGRVNLSNILAATASAIAGNLPLGVIEKALQGSKQVRGRLNFAYRNDFSVIVDYAHSDDSLRNLLLSVKEITEGKLILVFGAGGSRDKTKRPRMGKVAAEFADKIIITSDNPRGEDPMEIIDHIIRGFPDGFNGFSVEPDRKKAIESGIEDAGRGDIVVIAGKGHEDYQIFADKTIHFDDFEVVNSITGGKSA